MKVTNSIVLGLLGAFCFQVAAKENSVLVLGDESKSTGAKMASINFEAGEEVSAFQMRLNLPADAKKINTSNCLSDLPKSHTGLCKAFGTRVAIVVYSADGKSFDPGLISVGRISYATRIGGAISVDKMASSGRDAQEDVVKSRVEGLN